jgi:hypothetical protein
MALQEKNKSIYPRSFYPNTLKRMYISLRFLLPVSGIFPGHCIATGKEKMIATTIYCFVA